MCLKYIFRNHYIFVDNVIQFIRCETRIGKCVKFVSIIIIYSFCFFF